MKHTPLSIDDIKPTKATLSLSSGYELTLEPWSLYIREWAITKYGASGLDQAFKTQSVKELSAIAYKMLEPASRKKFETLKDFRKAVLSPRDMLNLMTAVIKTIGLSEPQMEEIADAIESQEKKDLAPAADLLPSKTGA